MVEIPQIYKTVINTTPHRKSAQLDSYTKTRSDFVTAVVFLQLSFTVYNLFLSLLAMLVEDVGAADFVLLPFCPTSKLMHWQAKFGKPERYLLYEGRLLAYPVWSYHNGSTQFANTCIYAKN